MWPFTQKTSLALLTSCEIPHFLAEIAHLIFQLLLLIRNRSTSIILKGWMGRVFRRALQDFAQSEELIHLNLLVIFAFLKTHMQLLTIFIACVMELWGRLKL